MLNISKNASAVFYLLNVKGIGTARIHSILRDVENNRYSIYELVDNNFLSTNFLNKNQIEELNANKRQMDAQLDRLKTEEVHLVAYCDLGYPHRLKTILGDKAPVLLCIKGNHDLLNSKSVGFCGSRKASPKGILTATDCAEQLAQKGINVTSGYATGIDMTTHKAALISGGTTTIVLPEGIFHFRIKKELEEVWSWEKVCVISEFLPGIPWSVRNAMQRNTTICALSSIMILIEAGATGGSIEAGKTSLKLGVPLLAPTYEGMPETAVGNRQLLGQGAISIFKSRTTGKANLSYILNLVSKQNEVTYENFVHSAQMVHENDQLDLFSGKK